MREFMVELRGPHGWIQRLHVEAEDGGIAFRKAVKQCAQAHHQMEHTFQMVSIEEGKLTDSGWQADPKFYRT